MNRSYKKKTVEFYDNLNKDLVAKYLIDNPRLHAAIVFVLKNLSQDSSLIYDFGCGIGWSTHEFARHLTKTQTVGIDISGKLIKTAKKLFIAENLEYSDKDILEGFTKTSISPDVIVMIDVFEHIPVTARGEFYKQVNEVLHTSGKVFLTCPTPEYQQFLRKNEPQTLQPTDEDVTQEALNEFAEKLGGELTYYAKKSIWKSNDYFHAIIERNQLGKENFTNHSIKLESILRRRFRVKERLGFTVSRLDTFKAIIRNCIGYGT